NATISLGTAGNTADSGTLATSATKSVTVQDGGMLAGNGTIAAGSLVVSNGTLRPGFSVGHIDVDGSYQQGANGTLLVDINSATQYDTVNIAGTATLGGTLQINAANLVSAAPGTLFPIVAAGSVTGTFDSVESSGNNDVYFITKTIGNVVYALDENRGDMNGD